MFDASSHLYDVLYQKGLGKDYAAEVETVVEQLPGARTLLDVACGTGLHLQHLTRHFECVGTDLDVGMLGAAVRTSSSSTRTWSSSILVAASTR